MTFPHFGKDWRARWLVLPSWEALHRVAAITWDDENLAVYEHERIHGYGVTACSRFGRLLMPGILSRMGLPRCRACCAITGVPPGNGAPFNEGIDA